MLACAKSCPFVTLELGGRHEPCAGKPRTPAPPDGPGPRPDDEFSATERSRSREPASPRPNASSATQGLFATMISSAAAKGKWAAQKGFAKRATRGSHMPAETQRHTTPNHHFLPHASYTRLSREHLLQVLFCYCSPTAQLHNHHLLSRMKPIHV